MKKVRIGVFGAGRGMTMVHEIIGDPMAELVAVCDKYKPLLDNCRREAEAAGLTNITYYERFDDFYDSAVLISLGKIDEAMNKYN